MGTHFLRDSFFSAPRHDSQILILQIMCLLSIGLNNPLIDLDYNVDLWTNDVREWSHAGILSGLGENLGSFVNKKSVVVDDNVFLLSNSILELGEPENCKDSAQSTFYRVYLVVKGLVGILYGFVALFILVCGLLGLRGLVNYKRGYKERKACEGTRDSDIRWRGRQGRLMFAEKASVESKGVIFADTGS